MKYKAEHDEKVKFFFTSLFTINEAIAGTQNLATKTAMKLLRYRIVIYIHVSTKEDEKYLFKFHSVRA